MYFKWTLWTLAAPIWCVSCVILMCKVCCLWLLRRGVCLWSSVRRSLRSCLSVTTPALVGGAAGTVWFRMDLGNRASLTHQHPVYLFSVEYSISAKHDNISFKYGFGVTLHSHIWQIYFCLFPVRYLLSVSWTGSCLVCFQGSAAAL